MDARTPLEARRAEVLPRHGLQLHPAGQVVGAADLNHLSRVVADGANALIGGVQSAAVAGAQPDVPPHLRRQHWVGVAADEVARRVVLLQRLHRRAGAVALHHVTAVKTQPSGTSRAVVRTRCTGWCGSALRRAWYPAAISAGVIDTSVGVSGRHAGSLYVSYASMLGWSRNSSTAASSSARRWAVSGASAPRQVRSQR